MKTTTIIILTLTFLRLSSQTSTPHSTNSTGNGTAIGTSTFQICHVMKSDCKAGKLVTNERYEISDTSLAYIEGYIVDITGKKLPFVKIKFINQTDKETFLNMSDSTGQFKIYTDAGAYSIKLQAFGYQDLIINDLKFGIGHKRKIVIDMGEFCCLD